MCIMLVLPAGTIPALWTLPPRITQTSNVVPRGIVGIEATSIAGLLPNGCTSVQCHQCDGLPPLISHTLRAAAISVMAPLFSASSSRIAVICAEADEARASIRERSIIADGCILNDTYIEHSVIGVRSRIQAGATIRDALIMGADFYDSPDRLPVAGAPTMGIGHRTWIERTIVDKNARIGDDVRISPEGKAEFLDGPDFYIRDGIVIIPKNAVIMSGTVI